MQRSPDHVTFETLRLEAPDELGVVWLWLARADRGNSVAPAMVRDLLVALQQIREDDRARVLVLAGEGGVFCSGLDLKEVEGMFKLMTDRGAGAENPIAAGARAIQDVVLAIHGLPIATIAAVRKAALGGGMELSLACDLRVISATAKLALPEVRLGLVPDWGGTHRLPALIGLARATELLLTCETIDGQRAHEYGLATRLTDDEDVEAEAQSLAAAIAAHPAHAVREAKELLAGATAVSFEEGLAREALSQSRCVDARGSGLC
jgi:enoyl-CoA hydratase/carnithine racemase